MKLRRNGMINKIALFLSISLIAQFSLANCPLPVTFLFEGATTHCDGYLFTPDAEKEARQYKLDSEYYKYQYIKSSEIVIKYEDLVDNLQNQINVLSKISTVQQDTINNTKNNNIYYAVGGAILSLILYKNVK